MTAAGSRGGVTRPIDGHGCVLLDLDGTLYRGEEPVAGAAATVEALLREGLRVVYMTNNSSRTPEDVAATLVRHGFGATGGDVITSAVVTAAMLRHDGVRSAFVIGEKGIRAALATHGIAVAAAGEDAECVVVGWDRASDYAALRDACLLVQRGARLVATNADPAFPAPEGLWPGAGALLSVITTTTGVVPTVVGKPHGPIFHAARALGGNGEALVVGDRLDTDIEGAHRLGWRSLLVLTGITDRAMVEAASVRPTWVAEDVGGLLGAGLLS